MGFFDWMRRAASSVAAWAQLDLIDQITNMEMLDEAVRIAQQMNALNDQMTLGAQQREQTLMDMHNQTTDFMDHGTGTGIF